MKKILTIAASVCILALLQQIFMPKYMTQIFEGALIQEYYSEKTPHDILFVGDCEVYETISPIVLWEKYGITSYIRGSAQQLIWQSYYILEETLKYEKPDVVVFNVLSMKYDTPQSEAYNRMTIDGMKLSSSKIKNVFASMTKDEEFITYIFPFLRYHSRWKELSYEDLKYLFNRETKSHNGYLMRVDTLPAGDIPVGRRLANYSFDELCYSYLDKMTKLCKDNGIEFILMKAPSLYPYWYDEWETQMVEYAAQNDLMYINFLELSEEIGIDFNEDTYDGGLHVNLSGAEKLSIYFGEILSETYQLPRREHDENVFRVWSEKSDFYYAMMEDQYRELDEYGYLKSYGGRAR